VASLRSREGDEGVEGNSDKVKGLMLRPAFLKKA